MKPSDAKAFSQLVTDVMAFYGKDASPFALSVWWNACKNFDLEQVRGAMNAHAMDPESGMFPPKPADVVRLLQGTATDRSRQAWGKLMDAMQRVGAYQSVVFDDPVIHAVVDDLGGWIKLCRSNMDELSYTEHRFCESYRSYTNRPGALESYPAKLLGQHELDNRQSGRRVAPPVLLGDPAKAQQIMSLGGEGNRQQVTFTTLLDSVASNVRRLDAAA